MVFYLSPYMRDAVLGPVLESLEGRWPSCDVESAARGLELD